MWWWCCHREPQEVSMYLRSRSHPWSAASQHHPWRSEARWKPEWLEGTPFVVTSKYSRVTVRISFVSVPLNGANNKPHIQGFQIVLAQRQKYMCIMFIIINVGVLFYLKLHIFLSPFIFFFLFHLNDWVFSFFIYFVVNFYFLFKK